VPVPEASELSLALVSLLNATTTLADQGQELRNRRLKKRKRRHNLLHGYLKIPKQGLSEESQQLLS